METKIVPDLTLDVSGLCCPMPVLKAKKAIDTLATGQILEVIGTDPGSKSDMPAWANRAGHEFLGSEEENGKFKFYIRKG